MSRKTFPAEGIYTVIGGICESYYMDKAAFRRYRYITPKPGTQACNVIADCWIVDRNGHRNPGTGLSAVPFCREAVGRRMA